MLRNRQQCLCTSICVLILILNATATNHWLRTKFGSIVSQHDSPFFMQRPDDLLAFLNQTQYQEQVDALYKNLYHIKAVLQFKFSNVESYAQGFVQQTKCMFKYFLEEGDLFASIGSKSYLDRVLGDPINAHLKPTSDDPGHADDLLPKCDEYLPLEFSSFCFEHLPALQQRGNLSMDAEKPLKWNELGFNNEWFAKALAVALKKDATAWQVHTLSSYYWRLSGRAQEAIECSRRAIYLSPATHRDIAMLSLGTILQRSGHHADAAVVLEAATDLNPPVAENHFALANSLTFLGQFNRSVEAYEMASSLDDAFNARVTYVKQALVCYKYVKSRLVRIERVIEEISTLLQEYNDSKGLLDEYLKKMLAQQVPLSARDYYKGRDLPAERDGGGEGNRGQYCAQRISPETNEPVLFCEKQAGVENDDVSVELINLYLDQTRELINTHKRSAGVFEQLDVESLGDVPGVPLSLVVGDETLVDDESK